MGRNKNSTSQMGVAEKMHTPLAQRLDELITDTNALKDHLGVSIQAVNQYRLGLARPSLENLCKIADFYGVTTDYLLGLSDISTNKPDILSACETTGLSEKAIKWLNMVYHHEHGPDGVGLGAAAKGYTIGSVGILSELIESDKIFQLLNPLTFYLIYGGILPPDAYTNDEPELTYEEHRRFYQWANKRGLEIQPRKDICEMHLQKACDALKDISRDVLERRKEKNGKHQERD